MIPPQDSLSIGFAQHMIFVQDLYFTSVPAKPILL